LVDGLFRRATSRQQALVGDARGRLDARGATLRALDPRAVLARGYALLHAASDGALIGNVTLASPDRRFRAHFADGVAPGTFGPAASDDSRGDRPWTP
jgi:exonuclease VII large subunit